MGERLGNHHLFLSGGIKQGGGYHLTGEECHGNHQETVKVCEHVSLCDEEGVEVGGEEATHLLKQARA